MNRKSRATLALAWGSMLLLSILPDVLYQELTGSTSQWIFVGKLVLLTALLWLTLFWEPARKLRSLYLVVVMLFVVEEAFFRLGNWPQWQALFDTRSFTWELFGIQLRRVGSAVAMILALLVLGFQRKDFFLQRGDLRAPSSPMPLFGFTKESHWTRLGSRLALYIGGALLIVMWLLGRPSAAAWGGLLPLLPAILLLAAMNAFGEEMLYRAALLAPTHRVLGDEQAILLTAAYFGIGHYYGVPYGVIGVLLAAFFGWVLGRAMLETKGFFWPWLIHALIDLVIFSFMAMGALAPGGF